MSWFSAIGWNVILPALYLLIIFIEGREAMRSVPRPRDAARLLTNFVFVSCGSFASIQEAHEHRWLWAPEIVAVALVAYNLWREFRRRRKPKPAKARGRVVNLGHRLAVKAE